MARTLYEFADMLRDDVLAMRGVTALSPERRAEMMALIDGDDYYNPERYRKALAAIGEHVLRKRELEALELASALLAAPSCMVTIPAATYARLILNSTR
jgi:hypothetical protein